MDMPDMPSEGIWRWERRVYPQKISKVPGTRGKRPGKADLTRLRRAGVEPTYPRHVGFGEDHPLGPAARRAGGVDRAAAGGERRPDTGGRRATRRGRGAQGPERPARGEAE